MNPNFDKAMREFLNDLDGDETPQYYVVRSIVQLTAAIRQLEDTIKAIHAEHDSEDRE